MIEVSKEERQAMSDELMEASGVRLQRSDQFTTKEFAESQNISVQTAMRVLKSLVDRGVLECNEALLHNGRRG